MRNTVVIILLTMMTLYTQGQETNSKNWKFNFQLDNRFSSIRNTDILIFGAKIGSQYKNSLRVGGGVSFITNPVEVAFFNRKNNVRGTVHIGFWYGSLFTDLILYKNEKWEWLITEQIGFGKPSIVRTTVDDEVVRAARVNLWVNEISTQTSYKIRPWIGAGIGVGYRRIFNGDNLLSDTFNAPIYIGKLILYPQYWFKK